jgi:hypothetical protein
MAQLALNRFKTETIELTTDDQTIYTAPTGYTGIVLYAHITNVASSSTTVTMSHVRSSTTTEIIKDATVPVNDAYIPLDGKLVLQTNDSIKASAGANSTLKVLLSVLETAN